MKNRPKESTANGADQRAGLLRLYVLHQAGLQPFGGLSLVHRLASRGVRLSPAALHPVLHGLEADGLLRSESVDQGKVRRL